MDFSLRQIIGVKLERFEGEDNGEIEVHLRMTGGNKRVHSELYTPRPVLRTEYLPLTPCPTPIN